MVGWPILLPSLGTPPYPGIPLATHFTAEYWALGAERAGL